MRSTYRNYRKGVDRDDKQLARQKVTARKMRGMHTPTRSLRRGAPCGRKCKFTGRRITEDTSLRGWSSSGVGFSRCAPPWSRLQNRDRRQDSGRRARVHGMSEGKESSDDDRQSLRSTVIPLLTRLGWNRHTAKLVRLNHPETTGDRKRPGPQSGLNSSRGRRDLACVTSQRL